MAWIGGILVGFLAAAACFYGGAILGARFVFKRVRKVSDDFMDWYSSGDKDSYTITEINKAFFNLFLKPLDPEGAKDIPDLED